MKFIKNLISILFVFFLGITTYSQEIVPLTQSEKTIIDESHSKAVFRILQITDAEDLAVLKAESIAVEANDPLVRKMAERMLATVQDEPARGVGIAAPQIGINRKAFWVQRFDKEYQPFEFFINPEIISYSLEKQKGREGCLSIPDVYGEVLRSQSVTIQYVDFEGKSHTETIEGFTAVIVQHEYDHLSGIFFTDRIEEQK